MSFTAVFSSLCKLADGFQARLPIGGPYTKTGCSLLVEQGVFSFFYRATACYVRNTNELVDCSEETNRAYVIQRYFLYTYRAREVWS